MWFVETTLHRLLISSYISDKLFQFCIVKILIQQNTRFYLLVRIRTLSIYFSSLLIAILLVGNKSF